MYVGQMHVHGQYRQFACKHYILYMYLEETNNHSKCVASPQLTTPSQHGVTGTCVADSFTVNLSVIYVLGHVTVSMALLHKLRCSLVIHTIVTQSRTVVHVTYYRAKRQRKPPHTQQCS